MQRLHGRICPFFHTARELLWLRQQRAAIPQAAYQLCKALVQ